MTTSPSKAKGTAFEHFLREAITEATGDLWLPHGDGIFVLEAKNANLVHKSKWLDETIREEHNARAQADKVYGSALIAHTPGTRKPARQTVFLPDRTLIWILNVWLPALLPDHRYEVAPVGTGEEIIHAVVIGGGIVQINRTRRRHPKQDHYNITTLAGFLELLGHPCTAWA